MVKFVLLTILSKIRFVFYPIITFPDPLENYHRRTELDVIEDRLIREEEALFALKAALDKEKKAVDHYRRTLDAQYFRFAQDRRKFIDMQQEGYEEVLLKDGYGRKVSSLQY